MTFPTSERSFEAISIPTRVYTMWAEGSCGLDGTTVEESTSGKTTQFILELEIFWATR